MFDSPKGTRNPSDVFDRTTGNMWKENNLSMDLKELAQKGEEIYTRNYKDELEKSHHGQFIAIDVENESYYLGSTPEEAAQKAAQENPGGFFHLIRIGFSGVYRMGTLLSNADYSIF